jgi:hypothetical protein
VLKICKPVFAHGESSNEVQQAEFKPLYYNLYLMAGSACTQLDMLVPAEQSFRKAIGIDGNNSQAWQVCRSG